MSATQPGHDRIWAWREEMGDVYTGEWSPKDDPNAPMEAVEYVRIDTYDFLANIDARLDAIADTATRQAELDAARIADLESQLAEAREVKPEHAEMLAKEMQAIVAADRWKGRDLSAAPPEKWSHLRPETRQFWIDTAARILSALKGTP